MEFTYNAGQLYLEHHGVSGQKWGVRHGPPYPLDSSATVQARKKAEHEPERSTEGPNDYEKRAKKEITKSKINAVVHALTLHPIKAVNDIKEISEIKETRDRARIKMPEREEILKTEQIDKKTGFHLKNDEDLDTLDDVRNDVYSTNPYFIWNDVTSHHNCQNCSIAYDMRRRGYDVMAAPKGKKDVNEDENLKQLYGVKHKSIAVKKGYAKDSDLNNWETSRLSNSLDKFLSKEKNSHGIISVCWAGGNVGHSMQYEVINGKTWYLDGQSSSCMTKDEFKDVLKMTDGDIWCYRLDNKKVNLKKVKNYVA